MTHRITPDQAGQRLDAVVAQLAGITRSRAQGLIAAGQVTLNGAVPKKNGVALEEYDTIDYQLPDLEPIRAQPQQISLDVVYEDSDLIVVNKARGMVVHPAAGNPDGTLVNALLAHCGDLSGIGGALRPGIVHRLDKETTGLLVAAKNDKTHVSLSAQLKDRTVSRLYTAVCYGTPKQEELLIDRPIGRHKTDRKKMAVVENGRGAQTEALVWEYLHGCTLLKLKLHTGRTHQIRVHLLSLGHPVLGDEVYGHAAAQKRAPVLMLHAYSLSFQHPGTKESLHFSSPPPEDFLSPLRSFGWSGTAYWEAQ